MIARAVVLELDRMLGTDLSALRLEREQMPHEDFLRTLERHLDGAPAETRALVAHLTPRRGGLTAALFEILFVPRLQRVEYVDNAATTPSWKIERLLIEYALWSVRVDEVLAALTKGFCAARCDRLPAGCCTVLGYDLGLVPGAMLRAQELEAHQRGWTPPTQEETCRYHGPGGCCLRLFKSPACAGMLCDALQEELRRRFERGPLEAFLRPLSRFRNHALDRAEIFETMAEVVATGRRLVDQSAKTCVQ